MIAQKWPFLFSLKNNVEREYVLVYSTVVGIAKMVELRLYILDLIKRTKSKLYLLIQKIAIIGKH